ncbi:MAG: hypothetical protein H0T79_02430 [Deltaproteobacteria bacterium]|nr:hypothetical protein [Deltaproteobacteria bacterium]
MRTLALLRDVPDTSTETTLGIALAADGTATVKLVKGPSDGQIDALVGPHKLW